MALTPGGRIGPYQVSPINIVLNWDAALPKK